MSDADRLFREYAEPLVRYLTCQTGDRDVAEELAQETFLRALRYRDARHVAPANERGCLFTIATNLLRDNARRDARHVRGMQRLHEEESVRAAPSFEPELLQDARFATQALQALSERDRSALLMREEGLPYAEIAESLGISVQSWERRCRVHDDAWRSSIKRSERSLPGREMLMSESDDNRGGALTFRAMWSVHGHALEETLHAWLDNELDAADSLAVEGHVDVCARCAVLFADVGEIRAIVASALVTFDAAPARAMSPAPVRRPEHVNARQSTAALTVSGARLALLPGRPKYGNTFVLRAAVVGALMTGTALYAMTHRPRAHGVVTTLPLSDGVPSVSVPLSGTPSTTKSTVGGTRSIKQSLGVHQPSAQQRYVIGGVVRSDRAALRGALVRVSGTEMMATTDLQGHFEIRGVPANSTQLTVTALAYADQTMTFTFNEQKSANVVVMMHEDVLRLNTQVVGDARAVAIDAAVQCLRLVGPAASRSTPVFRSLRGVMTSPSAYRLDVVGWPTRSKTTNTAFVLGSDETLHGAATSGNATLLIRLSRKGGSWLGTATEMRGDSQRSQRIILKSETLKQRCR